MKALEPLEKSLNDLFVKKLPAMPKGGKDFFVRYAPWASLIIGLFSLWSAWTLYRWASTANQIVDLANRWSEALGVNTGVSTSRWTAMLWISLIVIAITGVLYLFAFSPLKDRKKAGWNLVFYALTLNLIYGVLSIFGDYGNAIVGTIIGFAIGGWILFQIRDAYSEKGVPTTKPAATQDSSTSNE